MTGPCAKMTVRCTLVTPAGEHIVGTNHCENPQPVCPRAPGEGYEKCTSVCRQVGHAEVVAATGVPVAAQPAASRTVESLQRELLAIARGGKFAAAWAKVNGVQGSDGINLRAEMDKLSRVRELRTQIRMIDPDAALYYGWVAPFDDYDPARARREAASAETMRLFGPKGDN